MMAARRRETAGRSDQRRPQPQYNILPTPTTPRRKRPNSQWQATTTISNKILVPRTVKIQGHAGGHNQYRISGEQRRAQR
ncbi:hypothetical protein PAHAL_1G417100 [Panicum hallii]|uniref:Uncharacterized protein n=1 Tax=Panicum hallii TaxID=206008 RepID=A0A2T8KY02_9POAL|nr:hypothetical protein PAHAL_1G417100 [Panicum hallii]